MVFPWFAAQASVAVLAAGGAAGGFVSYFVRTRLSELSRKDTRRSGEPLDQGPAVVPVLVEPEPAEPAERIERSRARAAHERWEADPAAPSETHDAGETQR